MGFRERKKGRTERYLKHHYKNKLVKCVSCNGSGFYDDWGGKKCDCCEGRGKVREK